MFCLPAAQRDAQWPEAQEEMLEEDVMKIVIQVNGKLRSEIDVDPDVQKRKLKK